MMEMIKVNGPNGLVVNVPKGTSPEQINTIMSDIYSKNNQGGQSAAQPQPQSNGSLLENTAKTGASWLGSLGQGIAQGTYNVGQGLLDMMPALHADWTGKTPYADAKGNIIKSKSVAIPQSLNPANAPSINQTFGLPENFANDVIYSAGKAAPIILGGEIIAPTKAIGFGANVLKQAIEGGIGSAAEGGDFKTGALIGGSVPLGLHGAGSALGKLISPLKHAIAERAFPQVLKKEFSMNDAPETIMENGESLLREKFADNYAQYNLLNNKASEIAEKLDTHTFVPKGSVKTGNEPASGFKFDNSEYIKSLKEMKKNLNPYREKDAEMIRDIDSLLRKPPKTFKEAMETRKDINALGLNNATHTARESLIKSVDDNVGKLGSKEAKDFKELWSNANKQYKENLVPFFQSYDPYSNLVHNNALKKSFFAEGNGQGNLINNYTPKGSRVDILNQQHLGKLLNDEASAREIGRAAKFKDNFASDNTPNFTTFINKYEKLSPKQRGAYFSPDQIKLLNTINSLYRSRLGQGVLGKAGEKALAGGIGAAVGSLFGSPKTGGVAGLAISNKLMDALVEPFTKTERFMNLAKEIKKVEKK